MFLFINWQLNVTKPSKLLKALSDSNLTTCKTKTHQWKLSRTIRPKNTLSREIGGCMKTIAVQKLHFSTE